MVIDDLHQEGIEVRFGTGEQRVICPQCSPFRRKARDRCLAVNIDDDHAVWHCWHCGWSGSTGSRRNLGRKSPQVVTRDFGTAQRRVRYDVLS